MAKYYIWTIGCQMNKADSEFVSRYLEQAGYSEVANLDEADFILLNSCVVRNSAEQKVINKISSLKALKKKSPNVTIALTGCLVDSETEDLHKRFPHLDLIFRPQQWEALSQWSKKQGLTCSDDNTESIANTGITAFIPIIQGCNSFCSYCIVPYRRGREKSVPIDNVLHRARTLVKQGVKEITLVGQTVDSYGQDLPSHPDLADLLEEMSKIDDLLRIRFLTNHPKDMSRKLIDTVAGLDKVCESINLPVQAGDNGILEAMRRGYTIEQYRSLIGGIRSTIANIALTTDVIVGFPGETEQQFENTLELLREVRFDKVHIASYSPREGTIAAREMIDDVLPEEKKRRQSIAETLEESIATEINSGFMNKIVEVLVEGKKKGKYWGRTRQDKLVFFTTDKDLTGQLVDVQVNKTSPWSLQGTLDK